MRALSYEYDVGKLWLGAHYGNLEIHARTDAQSNLAGLWRAVDDQFYCGRLILRFRTGAGALTAKRTGFHPSHQITTYSGNGIDVAKTFFVPYGTDDECRAYSVVRAHNTLETPVTLVVELLAHFPLFVGTEYTKMPEPLQLEKRVHSELVNGVVLTRTAGRENEVRALASTAALSESRFTDRSANLLYHITLEPGEEREECFCYVISSAGADDVLARSRLALHYQPVFTHTEATFGALVARCEIGTPDAVLNRATRWAKVNMIRDQRRFPIGLGFTNDPPQDILVVRDVAWFTVGCDYFVSDFSRGALDVIRDHGVEPGGALTEYILASDNPPYMSNYGLNINDDTPLFVFAVHHHFGLTKDRGFLTAMYPTVRNAANWILGQERDGLIWCTSEESNLWGICSWRNVIPGYQLTGAVTEINAECYMSLYLASRCAEVLGEADDAHRFREAAIALRANINSQLVSERTGVYLLNIDNAGVRHHDLTGDMIFPLLFGVADDDVRSKVLDILTGPGFWTEYGARTVAPGQPNYDPERSLQLLGGVWPNLTAWIGYAARFDRPDLMVDAMRRVYRLCETDEPIAFKNVVPGQFPERLNGATFESCGMALSPWMPPTFFWLAMDGLVGFRPNLGQLIVQPHLPSTWKWVAVRRFPYAGTLHSLFILGGVLYSTLDVRTDYPVELFDEDISQQVESNAFVIALRRGTQATVFIGAADAQEVLLRLKPPLVAHARDERLTLAAGSAQLITIDAEERLSR